MPAPQPVSTIDELLALPNDGMRHELLDGTHAVTPAPSVPHQVVLSQLYSVLHEAVSQQSDTALVLMGPADVQLGPQTLVHPDLFIVNPPTPQVPRNWRDLPTPLLTAEILSPSTASRDRGLKRRLYLDAGVEEYWIVDVDARLIERWRSAEARPDVVHEELHWSLSVGISGTVYVNEIFRRV